LTIAFVPDVSGGRVQLVNQLSFKIQYDEFAFHITNFNIGSAFGTDLSDIDPIIGASEFSHEDAPVVKMIVSVRLNPMSVDIVASYA
jgi:hypothetical protein